MAHPVEPKTADPPVARPMFRYGIGLSLGRQGGMEGRIENGHLRHARQFCFRGCQGFQARGVVQRCQVGKGGDVCADFRRDSHRGRKWAAMDHSVPNGRQGDGASVDQVAQHAPHRFRMSLPRNVLAPLWAAWACVLVVGHRPGPVGQTMGDNPAIGRFHQRAFQATGTGIE